MKLRLGSDVFELVGPLQQRGGGSVLRLRDRDALLGWLRGAAGDADAVARLRWQLARSAPALPLHRWSDERVLAEAADRLVRGELRVRRRPGSRPQGGGGPATRGAMQEGPAEDEASDAGEPVATPLGELEVTVRERRSRQGVADVTVSIQGPSPATDVTGADGRVFLGGLSPGSYEIRIEQPEVTLDPAAVTARVSAERTTRTSLVVRRVLRTVRLKRKHIRLSGDDKYGHWWTEIAAVEGQPLSQQESYGWWPAGGVGLIETLGGTRGVLNGEGHFLGGTATQDPHHGDSADEDFHPKILSGATPDQVKACLRGYATSYSGEWRWTFGAGQNCHTFQQGMMKHCRLGR